MREDGILTIQQTFIIEFLEVIFLERNTRISQEGSEAPRSQTPLGRNLHAQSHMGGMMTQRLPLKKNDTCELLLKKDPHAQL